MLSKPALCLFVLALCTIANTVSAATEDDYGIIIDAGSTGSRAYLYSWPRRVIEGTQPGPPTTLVVSQPVMSTKGGALSEAKPEAIGELLTPLLAECKAFLVGKNIDISKIPVYLGATAGMRLLPADTRESIMIATRKYFAHSGFYFKDIFSKILSGEEEGLFGWIAANYLLGHFKPESSLLETFGALDLGGASTQITVDPRVTIMEDYFDFHGPYRKYVVTILVTSRHVSHTLIDPLQIHVSHCTDSHLAMSFLIPFFLLISFFLSFFRLFTLPGATICTRTLS